MAAEQYVVIAEGAGTDLSPAEAAEARVKVGQTIELRVYVDQPLSKDQIGAIESSLLAQGVVLAEPLAYDSGVVVARYVKAPAPETKGIGQGPLLVPELIIAGIALIGTVVFAWQMAGKVGTSLSNPLLVIGVLAIVVVYFTFRSGHREEQQAPPQEVQRYG